MSKKFEYHSPDTELDCPGIDGQEFKITFGNNGSPFGKGDVLTADGGIQVVVTKVYRVTWWKKVLAWLGIKRKWMLFTGVKVKQI